MSCEIGRGSESKIIGSPITAASTKAVAPISLRRARFFSGSIGSIGSSSGALLRLGRTGVCSSSASCCVLPPNENKPINLSA
jgi:hypothetical protein